MKLGNLERGASEVDESVRLKPLLVQLLIEAKLPVSSFTSTLIYNILFTTHQNLDGDLKCLRHRQQKRLLRFLNHKAFLSKLAELASKLFDAKFVHNRVMKPAMDQLEVVRKLQVEVKETIKKAVQKEIQKEVRKEVQEHKPEVPEESLSLAPAGGCAEQGRLLQTLVKKTTKKNKETKPRTTESQKKYRKVRESQVLPPPRKVPKNTDPKQKLNKASILRTGATINQKMDYELQVIQNLALGSYCNPYQEKIEEIEANVLKKLQDQEIQKQKFNLCRAIQKQAKRAQLLRVKKKKVSVNLLKSQKLELASQWRKRRDEDYERVRILCESIQASRNSKRYTEEQKREGAHSMNQDLQQNLQKTKEVWQKTRNEKMRHHFKTSENIERHRLGTNKINDKALSVGLLCELPLAELKTTLQRLRNQRIDQVAQQRAKKQVERNRELDKLEELMRIIDKHKKIQEKQRLQK